MRRRGWNKNQLSNIKLFKNEAAALAVDIALTEAARQRVKPRSGCSTRDSRSRPKSDGKPNGNFPQRKVGKGSMRMQSEWIDSCLNPKCDRLHPLKDCPNTSPERKKELFEEHYKNKKAKKHTAAKSLYIPPVFLYPAPIKGDFGLHLRTPYWIRSSGIQAMISTPSQP